jgi:CDP-6-deoxy-D-xylo-4-hexulose-3-dehydrase
MSDKNSLNALVKAVLDENREELRQNQKFFYPLAEPTYDETEVLSALESMTKFSTTMWDKVKEFESKFGKKYGGEAVMVNSGSSADLLIAFALLDKSGGTLRQGDEVLIPAVTWPTHLWSFLMAGFNVRLVDVSIDSLNFDINILKSEVSSRTRAISIVHLLGNVGNLSELESFCKQNNIILIEDCCEALGSKFRGKHVGTFGLASSFSFFFSHHLMTMEGGMILTQNKEFANRCRLLRSHGWAKELGEYVGQDGLDPRYRFLTWGFNVRPTELQASFGIVQLEKMSKFERFRELNVEHFNSGLSKHSSWLRTMKIEEDVDCSWFAYPIIVLKSAPFTARDLMEHLTSSGVENRPIVAGNLAKQPAVANFPEIKFGSLGGANLLHESGLYIGIHPKEDEIRINEVLLKLDQFCSRYSG